MALTQDLGSAEVGQLAGAAVPRVVVLLVEDNDAYRRVVCLALSRRLPDTEILEASNLETAKAIAITRRLDVVVTDIGLEHGSGLDLIQALSVPQNGGPKVVVFSNYGEAELGKALQKTGIFRFVPKEQGVSALAEAIDAASLRNRC